MNIHDKASLVSNGDSKHTGETQGSWGVWFQLHHQNKSYRSTKLQQQALLTQSVGILGIPEAMWVLERAN